MSLPVPKPGLVIRYGFLWSHEHDRGAVEAAKDRPCAIIVAVPSGDVGIHTVVVPITHRPPADLAVSLEIPADICRTLGLDAERHWIRFDELNRFVWPGYDLRPLSDGRYEYGMLPSGLFQELRGRLVVLTKARRGRTIPREG